MARMSWIMESKSSGSPFEAVIENNYPPQQIYSGMPTDAQILRYSYYELGGELTSVQLTYIKDFRTANGLDAPNLYYYRNFMSANNNGLATTAEGYSGEGQGQSDTVFFRSKGWLLLDVDNNEITFTVGINTEYMIDIGNVDYRAWLASYISNRVSLGYTGVFCDNLPAPTYPATWTVSVRGINPRTGLSYTDATWSSDSIALAQATMNEGVTLVGNGIPQADGAYGYWDNQTRCENIVSTIDGVLIEGPIGWTLTDFNSRTAANWKENVDMLIALVNTGKQVWFSNGGEAAMETDDVARFVYCTYMLVGPVSTYCLKFRGVDYMSGTYWTSLVELDFGAPTSGSMVLEGSEYVRYYTHGEVRVNPTSRTASYTIY
jgi:hypothetical protein